MFSSKKYELVKALHESQKGYKPTYDPYDQWENNVGECQAHFYGICLYEELGEKLPCFGCYGYY